MRILLFLLLVSPSIFAQLNLTQAGHLDLCTAHDQMLNDVWGYTDELGNEYALVGGTKGTSVVDISDPANPTEIFYEPGMESIWRDLKTWGDYAYVTTEAQNGLLIIDLSPLPLSTSLSTYFYTGPLGNEWQSAHNLYIDSAGYCYIFGANRGNGGVIILDLNADPINPVEVGTFDNWYAHDGFADNDTLFLGHISDGFISVVDVIDRANPVLLGTAYTPSTFSHNVWTSNGHYAFSTDEVSGGYIGSFDVSDPANIVELDRIRSSPGAGVIPHNTHVIENFLVTSYYSDGVVVHDMTYPYNLIEVGNFDTYPTQTTSYDGCWGAFPWFESGTILASDRTQGLFVLSPNYTQAAYLEGTVTNASTLAPVDQVEVAIVGNNQLENTSSIGFYATGTALGGTYDVTYSKVGYYPQTISTTLTNGVISTQNVQLVPIPPYSLDVTVLDQVSGLPVSGADISLGATLITHTGSTNGLGEENFNLYYEETYELIVGKWGFVTHCEMTPIDNTTGSITIYVDSGFYDDFTFDFGWTVTGSAATGSFDRGEPNPTSSGSQTDLDVGADCGTRCYVTGNDPNIDPNHDDVDDGETILKSPIMDLMTYADPYVNFSAWFYNYHGPSAPDDFLTVYVNNGLSGDIGIQVIMADPLLFAASWQDYSLRIVDFVPITNTMQFSFKTSDIEPNGNITEAAIDHFYIADAAELNVSEITSAYELYPNPVSDFLMVSEAFGKYRLNDLNGKIVLEGELNGVDNKIDVRGLDAGNYLFELDGIHKKVIVNK